MYVKEKLNNIGRGYTNFIENTLEPIVEKGYIFLDEGGLMGEFNKYVCQFGYSREDEKKASAIVDKFVKTYFKKVGGFIQKCENEMNEMLDIIGWPKRAHYIGPMAIQWHKYRDLHPYSEWRKMFKDKSDNVGFVRLPKENVKNWDVVFSTIHSYIDLKKAA